MNATIIVNPDGSMVAMPPMQTKLQVSFSPTTIVLLIVVATVAVIRRIRR